MGERRGGGGGVLMYVSFYSPRLPAGTTGGSKSSNRSQVFQTSADVVSHLIFGVFLCESFDFCCIFVFFVFF